MSWIKSLLGIGSPESKADLRRDFIASIVVFLVALPLCLGIAVACGVPPALGLITGIIGGLAVGSMSGCRLQVSGPAAGLTVLVFDLVQRHGLAALGVVVIGAGVLQILAGVFKVGRWFRAVSPAVINGMLAAIGVLLVAGQFYVMLDYKPLSSGLPNLLGMPRAAWNAVTGVDGSEHVCAAILAVITLSVLFTWKYFKLDKKLFLPGALPAIVLCMIVAAFFSMPVHFISVPDSLLGAVALPTLDSLATIINGPILVAILSMALVASAETLLSATAVDQMHNGTTTRYDKELVAQGVGNVLCGLLGSLPVTGVIARSSVNVEAGARTRRSTFLHGIWLLSFVVILPAVLRHVPVASLGALLVFTGFKLVDLSVFKKLRQFSKTESTIYLATVAMIVCTDLLTGVLFGLLLALVKQVWLMSQLNVSVAMGEDKQVVLKLEGAATFLGLPRLTEALDGIETGVTVRLDFERLTHIDHACIEVLRSWAARQEAGCGSLVVDWSALVGRYKEPVSIFSGHG